jgi:hypothetical protein
VAANDFTLDTADEWVTNVSSDIHGVGLRSVAFGIEIHVRTQPPYEHELTQRGLLALLRDQQWASRPFDETTRVVGSLIVVAGTFEMQGDEVVPNGSSPTEPRSRTRRCRVRVLTSPLLRQLQSASSHRFASRS